VGEGVEQRRPPGDVGVCICIGGDEIDQETDRHRVSCLGGKVDVAGLEIAEDWPNRPAVGDQQVGQPAAPVCVTESDAEVAVAME